MMIEWSVRPGNFWPSRGRSSFVVVVYRYPSGHILLLLTQKAEDKNKHPFIQHDTSTRRRNPLLLSTLAHLLLPRLKHLPHRPLARNPLLHLGIQFPQLFLLRIRLFHQRLFALLQRLSLLFQRLARGVLVLDAQDGQVVLAEFVVWCCVFRVGGEEFLGGGEREGGVDVAGLSKNLSVFPILRLRPRKPAS